jgi:3-hydroxyisobutyrate dehydrogenase-like beta-hydroxyacid dehydrogenase
MSKISVLGLGAMGTRMAAHLIKAGNDVTVWNRTADATKPLVVNRRPIDQRIRREKSQENS